LRQRQHGLAVFLQKHRLDVGLAPQLPLEILPAGHRQLLIEDLEIVERGMGTMKFRRA